ncbi:collagen alpha-1(I) chain-like [Vulpes lagopus]|uniref:collagen alpha-1(I) chain-like n=1 Tax=Vulpes lagopus TaxID=494514 RepID=UPI001BC9BE4A|nr:collagen alpha-1(I) chain-like [Vulpes lagopus]
MEQAATPGGPGLPCSHRQALALYQHLFRCPAGPGQLQAALQQVQESQACPSGLELPAVLLEMERSRRAQEQLLWDLELLTGAGLSLFWPPWAQFCGLKDQAQCVQSRCSKPRGRMGGGPEQLTSWVSGGTAEGKGIALPSTSSLHPRLLFGLSLSCAHMIAPQPLERVTPKFQLLGSSGCLQELNPATCSSFGDPGHSEVKGPGWGLGQQRAELQKLLRIEILQRPREEDPQEQKEGCPRGQRGEAPRGENKEVPKRQGEQLHQGPSGEATQALREEVSVNPRGEPPQGQGRNRPECPGKEGKEGKEVLREPRKETPQAREAKALQACPRRLSQARGVDEGEVPTPSPEEGGSPGISRDFHRSLGEQKPQPAGREGPGSGERTTQLTPGKTDGPRRESAPAGERRAEPQAAPDPGGSGRRERPAALPGRPGPGRDPEGGPGPGPGPAEQVRGGSARLVGAVGGRRGGARAPEASKAAWPGPPGAEKASAGAGAAQRETALQRLLELHRAAGRRRRQEREQQRLRVLEGLRIAKNRRCRVHPLGPPPGPARLPPQASLPGEGGGAPAILPGRGPGAGRSWVPSEGALAPPPTEGAGARLPGAAPCGLLRAAGWEARASGLHTAQEDAAGQRRALREQLQQVLRERTWRLRALGARNTQNFQQLLWPPGAEKPLPGEQRSPFPAPSSHC